MDITVLTLFPEIIENALSVSITGRAIDKGILSLKTKNIRDNAMKAYAKVDDTLYGGGTGMLMMCEPVYRSFQQIKEGFPEGKKIHTVYMSPKGKVLNQDKCFELAKKDNLVILCGHYEGCDQRVIDEIVDEEISIGDYVLTGGELPACVLIDSVSRLLPGVLSNTQAYEEESHIDGLLEHPQYTKPSVWMNREVPDVLLSGHHMKIREYNYMESLYETLKKRPDLFEKANIDSDDMEKFIVHIKNKKSID